MDGVIDILLKYGWWGILLLIVGILIWKLLPSYLDRKNKSLAIHDERSHELNRIAEDLLGQFKAAQAALQQIIRPNYEYGKPPIDELRKSVDAILEPLKASYAKSSTKLPQEVAGAFESALSDLTTSWGWFQSSPDVLSPNPTYQDKDFRDANDIIRKPLDSKLDDLESEIRSM